MTDNTPSEPMSREQVLAWIDGRILERNTFGARMTRAAIAALYERCEALERDIRYLTAIADATSGTEPSDAEGGG